MNEFLPHGISIQKIRKAAIIASDLLKTSHPFAIRKMFTDGKSIFAEIAQKGNDPSLLDLLNKQFQLDKIIEPLLFKCIDFGKHDYEEFNHGHSSYDFVHTELLLTGDVVVYIPMPPLSARYLVRRSP